MRLVSSTVAIIDDVNIVRDAVGYVNYFWGVDIDANEIYAIHEVLDNLGFCDTCSMEVESMVFYGRDEDGVEYTDGYYSFSIADVMRWVDAGRPPYEIRVDGEVVDVVSDMIVAHGAQDLFASPDSDCVGVSVSDIDWESVAVLPIIDTLDGCFFLEVYFDTVDGKQWKLSEEVGSTLWQVAVAHQWW